jgi:hypothetical protein
VALLVELGKAFVAAGAKAFVQSLFQARQDVTQVIVELIVEFKRYVYQVINDAFLREGLRQATVEFEYARNRFMSYDATGDVSWLTQAEQSAARAAQIAFSLSIPGFGAHVVAASLGLIRSRGQVDCGG